MKQGKVYLVGGGPGDPGLITVRGLDCLRKADVIIYDNLIDDSLLDLAPPEAEKIYVGKTPTHHAKEQDDINRLLVEKAREGKVVVRLKGGDPFVLGRGGEEAEALAESHIQFDVVPGISSAVAVPAYAGIPVTHRKLASSFAVITGHEDPSKDKSSIAWEKLATAVDTLIFLMGVANLPEIAKKLLEHGRNPSTPVALIKDGTGPGQQTLVSTLADIGAKVEESNVTPPAVIVVGDVVRLREKLRWFDNRPLFGKRILVTRARVQASALSRLLASCGALPVEMPVIEIQPTPHTKELDQAILCLETYDWIIFTSVNGAHAFLERLYALNFDARQLKGIRIGAIGPATAEALETHGLHPDYLAPTYTSEGLLAGLESQGVAGSRFLIPRADIADRELVEGIARLGAEAHEVTAYRTVPSNQACAHGKQILLAGGIDMVTFTSSSTVTNLLALLGTERSAVNRAKVACIGPKSAATAQKAGLKVDIVAKECTILGLVEAIEQYYRASEGEET